VITGEDLLKTLLTRGIRLWIHHGVLRYENSASISSIERDRLRLENDRIVQLLTEMSADQDPPIQQSPLTPLTFQQEFYLKNVGQKFSVQPLQLRGAFNVDAMSRSLGALVERHEALRSRIVVTDKGLRQQLSEIGTWQVTVENLEGLFAPDDENVSSIYIGAFVKKWLEAGNSSFDAMIVRLSKHDHILVMVEDCLFIDFESYFLMFSELRRLYDSFLSQQSLPLLPVSARYADYAVWQRRTHQAWVMEHQGYWRNRLAGAVPLRLRADQTWPRVTGFVAYEWKSLGGSASVALRELARREGTTLGLVMLAIFAVVASFWSAQRDFVVPIVFSGREDLKYADVIGSFTHLVFLRLQFHGDITFTELCKVITEEFMSATEHSGIGKAVCDSMPELLKCPLWQWLESFPDPMFPLIHGPDKHRELLTQSYVNWTPASGNPPSFTFYNVNEEIRGGLENGTAFFTSESTDDFFDDLRAVAEQAIRDSGTLVEGFRAFLDPRRPLQNPPRSNLPP